MELTHQGTIIDFKAGFKNSSQQQRVEEPKITAARLSDQKQKFQNPECLQDDKKNDSKLGTRIVQMWAQMTNLKRGLSIGGIFFIIVLIIILTLMIVVMTLRPIIVIKRVMVLPVKGTNETIQSYEVQATKQNLMSPNTNKNFQMHVITQNTKRMMQQGSTGTADASAVVLQFNYPKQGVTVLATSPDDLIVIVDYDQMMLAAYRDKRLLFQAEMMAALRNMQQDTATMNFEDPSGILDSAQNMLLKAVAGATNTNEDELNLEYVETVTIVRQDDNTFIIQDQPQSSRLLRAISSMRGLQQWDGVFEEVNNKVLVPIIEEVKENINVFVNADSNNPEVKNIIENSNFGDVDVNVVSEEPEDTSSRLLQDNASNSTTPDSSSKSKQEETKQKSKSKSEGKDKDKTKGNKKGNRKTWPFSPKKSKKGKALRSQDTSQKSYNSSTRCIGRGKVKRCDKNVINQPNSPFVIKQGNSTNQTISNLKASVSTYIEIKTGKLRGRGRGKPYYYIRPRPFDKIPVSKNLKTQEIQKKEPQPKKVEPKTTTVESKPSPQIVTNP